MIKINPKLNKFILKHSRAAIAAVFAVSLLAHSSVLAIDKNPETGRSMNQINVVLTAYSSTKDQTDSAPFIAASGKHVYDGMVAANFLPFGTKIKIPSLFGDKIFTVDDRMNKRHQDIVDIWQPNKKTAIEFGVKKATIEVVE